MTDGERIARLEATLGTLIAWLHRELGTHSARALLEQLSKDTACSCGAGHGSLEGHMDWCDWIDPPTKERE